MASCSGRLLVGRLAREAWPRYELDLVCREDGRPLRDECCDDWCLVVFAAQEPHRLGGQVLVAPLPQRIQGREQVDALGCEAVLVPHWTFLVGHAHEDPLL